VTKLGHYSLVLGIPWMRKHDVTICFASDTVIFDSPSCWGHPRDPVMVKGVNAESLEVGSLEVEMESVPVPPLAPVSPPSNSPVSPSPLWSPPTSPVSPLSPQLDTPVAKPPNIAPAAKPQNIAMISAASFRRLTKNHRQRYGPIHAFSLSMYEINKALERKSIEQGDLKSLVPHEFHEFLPLCDKVIADRLPPHRIYDQKIPLKDGFEPPFGPLL
jgi:hypothetical protein